MRMLGASLAVLLISVAAAPSTQERPGVVFPRIKEAGGIVVGGVPGSQRERLEGHDEQGQAHGQLRKQVVVGDGEGKMNSVNEERVVHDVLRRAGRHNSTS